VGTSPGNAPALDSPPAEAPPTRGSAEAERSAAAPPAGLRALTAVAIAAACGGLAYAYALNHPTWRGDTDQVWFAARTLLDGRNPYAEVGPGRAFDMRFGLYYPLPAVVAFTPLALLPVRAARALFVALSTGVLAFAVSRDGWWRLSMFLSGSMLMALMSAQWSPLLTAALYFPLLGAFFVAKPNVGLALGTYYDTAKSARAALWGTLALVAVSVIVQPTWPRDWLDAVRSAQHFVPPVRHLGGPLILLALLRWRRPEARMLVAFACVPHTTLVYEVLPLLLVAANLRESLILSALTAIVWLIPVVFPELATPVTARIAITGDLLVPLLYLPCVLLVLRRPNTGRVPAVVERVAEYVAARLGRSRPATRRRETR
jgi:hypothetical protein